MKIFLAILLLLAPISAHAGDCAPVTISANGTIQPWTQRFYTPLAELFPYFPWEKGGYNFPYTVPSGKYLGITSVHFASKHISRSGTHRNSYLMLWNLMTVTEQQPSISYSAPVVLPSGFVLDGGLSNADNSEAQNMNVLVTGWISSDPLFRECR